MPIPLSYRAYYHRHLPHYQPPNVTLFITFRLHGSLPVEVVERLRAEAEKREREIEKLENLIEEASTDFTDYADFQEINP